jgi:hypothetical protein
LIYRSRTKYRPAAQCWRSKKLQPDELDQRAEAVPRSAGLSGRALLPELSNKKANKTLLLKIDLIIRQKLIFI